MLQMSDMCTLLCPHWYRLNKKGIFVFLQSDQNLVVDYTNCYIPFNLPVPSMIWQSPGLCLYTCLWYPMMYLHWKKIRSDNDVNDEHFLLFYQTLHLLDGWGVGGHSELNISTEGARGQAGGFITSDNDVNDAHFLLFYQTLHLLDGWGVGGHSELNISTEGARGQAGVIPVQGLPRLAPVGPYKKSHDACRQCEHMYVRRRRSP